MFAGCNFNFQSQSYYTASWITCWDRGKKKRNSREGGSPHPPTHFPIISRLLMPFSGLNRNWFELLRCVCVCFSMRVARGVPNLIGLIKPIPEFTYYIISPWLPKLIFYNFPLTKSVRFMRKHLQWKVSQSDSFLWIKIISNKLTLMIR